MPIPRMRRGAATGKPDVSSGRSRLVPIVPDPADAGRIAEIFRRFAARDPAPMSELTYRTPYTFLVAVVLSAQATDASVNKATEPLFALVDNPKAMLELGEDRLKGYIKTIGLYNAKAKNVMALSERLLREFGGEVPRDRAVLQTLPGVGQKTAGVVVNTLHGDHAIAVDTHVFRVSNRMPVAVGATPDKVEAGLMAVVPPDYVRHAHHWLILHGRYTCTARKPLCPTCLVADLCRWPDKTA
jgi:endonuclease III